ncbi:MAG: FHA domain-containing protein [Acidobacteriia bacterium]|nr:FHA domain-containing protein [Terriglobia bacterium]
MPRLLIHHSVEGSRVFELLGDRPISIGRAKSSNLVLDNPSVSRLHAVVRSTPDGHWQIIDRASSNGVKVNGKASKEIVLRPNDEIVIGEYKLRFCEDSAAGNVVTYGTTELPPRFAKVLSEASYSGSFIPVQPVAGTGTAAGGPPAALAGVRSARVAPAGPGAAGIAASRVERPGSLEERVRALEHENRLLTLLYRVNCALNEVHTVEKISVRILDLVLEIDGAERGFTMLLDAASMGRGDFSKGDYNFEPAVIRHRTSGKPGAAPQLTISQSIIRQVMQGGAPLLIADAQADPRLSASESVVAAGIRSAMCAPLGVRERRFGLLYVDNLSRRGMFTVEDLNVFAVIASQAGLAIERSRAQAGVAEQLQPSAALE